MIIQYTQKMNPINSIKSDVYENELISEHFETLYGLNR
jgi:hypothetical protein